MVNGFRASEPNGLNRGCGSKLFVDSQVRQETPGEGRRIICREVCEYKDEDNNLKTLNDKKNHQASSEKFRQLNEAVYILHSINKLEKSLKPNNGLTLKMARSRRYPARNITDADNDYDTALLVNTSAKAKSLLHNLEQASM